MGRLLALVFGLFVAQGAMAASQAQAWSCNGYLVLEGDSAAHVAAVCGPPTHIATQTETITTTTGCEARGWVHHTRTETYEIWTYDLGPGYFIESLMIRAGVVQRTWRSGPGTRRER
jgi:hypothetical protein